VREELSALVHPYRDEPAGSPRWDYASELLTDGLIDVRFGLTPRGKRAIAAR